MAADTSGNDLDAVGVPITGLAAVAPVTEANVIAKLALSASPLVLPAGYERLGLFKVDGGPSTARESGDPIEFFQIGYKLAGDGTRSVTINLAEFNEIVQKVTEGATPDANGVIEASSSLPDGQWILFTSTRYRNGKEKRRVGVVTVTGVEDDQESRGEVEGRAVTFTYQEHDLFNGAPFWQWIGEPGTVIPED